MVGGTMKLIFLILVLSLGPLPTLQSMAGDVKFIACVTAYTIKCVIEKKLSPAMFPEFVDKMMAAGGSVPENHTDDCEKTVMPTVLCMRVGINKCQVDSKSELKLIFTPMTKIMSDACSDAEKSFQSANVVNGAQPKIPPVWPLIDPITKKKYTYCEHKQLAWPLVEAKGAAVPDEYGKMIFNVLSHLAYELAFGAGFGTGFKTMKTCETEK